MGIGGLGAWVSDLGFRVLAFQVWYSSGSGLAGAKHTKMGLHYRRMLFASLVSDLDF